MKDYGRIAALWKPELKKIHHPVPSPVSGCPKPISSFHIIFFINTQEERQNDNVEMFQDGWCYLFQFLNHLLDAEVITAVHNLSLHLC